MTPATPQGSDPKVEAEKGNGIVDLSPDSNRSIDSPHSPLDPVSNTENPFEEEHTEGFDIAPTGSGDLGERAARR